MQNIAARNQPSCVSLLLTMVLGSFVGATTVIGLLFAAVPRLDQ